MFGPQASGGYFLNAILCKKLFTFSIDAYKIVSGIYLIATELMTKERGIKATSQS